jgi:histone H3/H4
MSQPDTWRVCSICRSAIPFDHTYFSCSVSTCNRKRTALYFCSVGCFEAHIPMMRHRDAWAQQQRSPSREAYQREQLAAAEVGRPAAAETTECASSAAMPARRVVSDEALPRDVLVVVSKLKGYIRARSGMNTSDNVVGVLSDHLRHLCGCAIRKAAEDDRKTVMDRDFVQVLSERERG